VAKIPLLFLAIALVTAVVTAGAALYAGSAKSAPCNPGHCCPYECRLISLTAVVG
jgi:hypothetical protein